MNVASSEDTFANKSLTYADKTVDRSAAVVLPGGGIVGVEVI